MRNFVMIVLSWNVLFRNYEQKYNPTSRILASFSEDRRIQLINTFMQENLEVNTVICLQECSELLIETIKTTLPPMYTYFTAQTRNEDFLVTIVASKYGFSKEPLVHPTSRGYLVIANNKFRVINCHLVPQRYCEHDIMGYLKALPTDKICVVAGDFNEQYKKVLYRLKDRYTVPKYGKTYKRKEIDFIIIDRPVEYKTELIKMPVSDHSAIRFHF